MVDSDVKKILKGQNWGWNLLFVIVGGALFGVSTELGRIAIRHTLKQHFHLPLDY